MTGAEIKLTDDDEKGVRIVETDGGTIVGENGGTDTYTVVLTSEPAGTVRVTARSSDESAVRVKPALLTFTPQNWSKSQRVTVIGVADDFYNSGKARTAVITHGVSGADYEGVTAASVIVTVNDEDTPPTFSIADAEAPEGDVVVFTVTRSGARNNAVSVYWKSAADMAGSHPAGADEDYVVAAGSLDFSVGETLKIVSIQTIEDALDEENETFLVRLSAGDRVALIASGAGEATGMITDDDDTPKVSIADASPVQEGDTSRFRVRLSRPSDKTITVDWTTSPGTATEGVDYVGSKGTITLTAGSVEAVVQVATIDDKEIESATETFKVALSNFVNVTMEDAEGTGFIEDDDRPKAVARLQRVNEAILTRVGSALMRIRIDQMTQRIGHVVSGQQHGELSLLGRQLRDNEWVFGREDQYLEIEEHSHTELVRDETDEFSREERPLAEILGGARFLRTWRRDREQASGDIWFYAGGDWQRLSSIGDGPIVWDGKLSDAHLGGSVRLGGSALAGLDIAQHRSSVDWRDEAGGEPFKGDWRMRLNALYPYAAWFTPKGARLWAMAGHGWGIIHIKEETPFDQSANIKMKSIALGGALPLWRGVSGVSLRLRGDAWHGAFEVEDNGDLVKDLSVRTRGVRVFGEGEWRRSLNGGASLTPSVRIGFLYDEGADGAGGEVGSDLRWEHPSRGLAVTVSGRALFVRGDMREWGVGAEMRLTPADGLGPLLNLSVSRGGTADQTEALWESGLDTRSGLSDEGASSLYLEAGWGLGLPGGRGVLTPFAGLSLSEEDTRTVRFGGRWENGDRVRFELEARREERGHDTPDHGLLLRATVRW